MAEYHGVWTKKSELSYIFPYEFLLRRILYQHKWLIPGGLGAGPQEKRMIAELSREPASQFQHRQ